VHAKIKFNSSVIKRRALNYRGCVLSSTYSLQCCAHERVISYERHSLVPGTLMSRKASAVHVICRVLSLILNLRLSNLTEHAYTKFV
jgi:hypothetical protein